MTELPEAEKLRKTSEASLARARMNICQLAETKAKNRVRREILGLPSTFTPKDLQKPFLVIKLVPMIAEIIASDPELEREAKRRMLGWGNQMYGDQPAMPAMAEPAQLMPPIQSPADAGGLDVGQPPGEPTASIETFDAKLLQIGRVSDFYLRKLNAPRDPTKRPLTDLSQEELDAVEEALSKKPDHPDWVKSHPESIL